MDIIELGTLNNNIIVDQNNDVSFDSDNIPNGENNINNTITGESNFTIVNTYDGDGEPDTYQFQVGANGIYELELSNLEANLDLSVGDSEGNIIYSSNASGTESELINEEFAPGSYNAYITGEAGVTSSYSFAITQTIPEGETDNNQNNNEPIINQGDTVYRFLETEAQTQFYTTSEEERDIVRDTLPNYTYQGESFIGAPNPEATDIAGVIPVYRFFNSDTGVHLYTASEVEREFVTDNLANYIPEGVSYYGYESSVEGSVPLYRFYNQSLDAHFYTPSTTERDEFLADPAYSPEGDGEGIAYYINPVADI